MPRRSSKHPTELELEILKVLWRDGPSTVRHVREALTDFRELAHTSVMTIMGIMTDKRYLRRSKDGNRYVYRARVGEQETTAGILGQVVDRVFDGSAVSVLMRLLETHDIDAKELTELRRIIRKKETEKRP